MFAANTGKRKRADSEAESKSANNGKAEGVVIDIDSIMDEYNQPILDANGNPPPNFVDRLALNPNGLPPRVGYHKASGTTSFFVQLKPIPGKSTSAQPIVFRLRNVRCSKIFPRKWHVNYPIQYVESDFGSGQINEKSANSLPINYNSAHPDAQPVAASKPDAKPETIARLRESIIYGNRSINGWRSIVNQFAEHIFRGGVNGPMGKIDHIRCLKNPKTKQNKCDIDTHEILPVCMGYRPEDEEAFRAKLHREAKANGEEPPEPSQQELEILMQQAPKKAKDGSPCEPERSIWANIDRNCRLWIDKDEVLGTWWDDTQGPVKNGFIGTVFVQVNSFKIRDDKLRLDMSVIGIQIHKSFSGKEDVMASRDFSGSLTTFAATGPSSGGSGGSGAGGSGSGSGQGGDGDDDGGERDPKRARTVPDGPEMSGAALLAQKFTAGADAEPEDR